MRGLLEAASHSPPRLMGWVGRKQCLNGIFVGSPLLPLPEAQRGGAAVVWSDAQRLFLAL